MDLNSSCCFITVICFLTNTETIVKYRAKIRSLDAEIKQILKREEEEKQLRLTEMEINKASNLIEHKEEILSRPPRSWINRKRPAPSCDAEGSSALAAATGTLPSKKAKKERIKNELVKKKKNTDLVI